AGRFRYLVADIVDIVDVVAGTARHDVGSRPAVEIVVTGTAVQDVGATAADQVVVQLVAGQADARGCTRSIGAQVLDLLAGCHHPAGAGINVVAAATSRFAHHVVGIVYVVDVVACPSEHHVDAGATIQRVVTAAANHVVVAVETEERAA